MFADKVENLSKYVPMVPALKIVCDFLEKTDLNELPIGETKLSDGIFVNISEYEPYPEGDKWETHEKYADLQIVVEGNERMDWASRLDCKEGEGYNDEYDFEFYKYCDASYASVFGLPGVFAWFDPMDAHRPGLKYKADKVKKAVFKIPV